MPIVYDLNKPLELSKLVGKTIFADTNVIADMFYDKSSLVPHSRAEQLVIYHGFIARMIEAKVSLHITTQVLMETQNVFMKYDKAIYNSTHLKGEKYNQLKDFRSCPEEMQNRKIRYKLMLDQITNNGLICIDSTLITLDAVSDYVSTMDIQSLDSNDYILLAYSENSIIITDDRDFATPLAKCDLVTGNPQLLSLAKNCGFTEGN